MPSPKNTPLTNIGITDEENKQENQNYKQVKIKSQHLNHREDSMRAEVKVHKTIDIDHIHLFFLKLDHDDDT